MTTQPNILRNESGVKKLK